MDYNDEIEIRFLFEPKAPSLGWKAQPKSVKTDTIRSDPHISWKYPYGQKTPE
ncbi:hypothetical protein HU727_025390 [Pseudomonas sp. SWRI153]|uniref:Uncharacterized protein n=1 Tax=Pseudomonas khorasanensis TaxID=2745508 RepID=A0A923JHH2_9PSED|nr:hypothetical protein [Pseudomonas khorasanensis]MBV4488928.1 hypothetical protein [Pseudomonas khorasanensis]